MLSYLWLWVFCIHESLSTSMLIKVARAASFVNSRASWILERQRNVHDARGKGSCTYRRGREASFQERKGPLGLLSLSHASTALLFVASRKRELAHVATAPLSSPCRVLERQLMHFRTATKAIVAYYPSSRCRDSFSLQKVSSSSLSSDSIYL